MSNLYGHNDYNGPTGLFHDRNDGHKKSYHNKHDDEHHMNDDDEDDSNPLQIGYWLEGDSLSPPCGTSISTIHALLEFANLSAKDVIYDFGCGDGRVCIEAYTKYNCKQCVGIEIEEDLVAKAKNIILKLEENEAFAPPPSSTKGCSDINSNDVQESKNMQSRLLYNRSGILIVRNDLRNVLRKIVDGLNCYRGAIPWSSGDEDQLLLQRPTVLVLYLLPEAIAEIEPYLIQLLNKANDECDDNKDDNYDKQQQKLRIICIEYGLPNVQHTDTIDIPETVTKTLLNDKDRHGTSVATTTTETASIITTTSLYLYTSETAQLS